MMIKHFFYALIFMVGSSQALQAERIVSLSPPITEMIEAIGAQKHLVGKTFYCKTSHPNIKTVGDLLAPNLEKILALRPTHVLTSHLTPPTVRYHLKAMGIQTFDFRLETLQDILLTFDKIAHMFHQETQANEWITHFEPVKTQFPQKRRTVTILYGLGSCFSAGKQNFLNDLIELSGHTNLAAHASIRSQWPRLPMEFLLKENPDMLFVGLFEPIDTNHTLETYNSKIRAFYSQHSVWKHLKAVQNGSIFAIPLDWLTTPGLSIKPLLQIMLSFRNKN